MAVGLMAGMSALTSAAGAAGAGGGFGLGSAAGLGAGLGLFDAGLGFGFGELAASRGWDRWKKSLRRGPTYQMEGYRRAGINPILVARQGKLGPGAEALTGRQQRVSTASAAADMAMKQSQIGLVRQQTATSASQARLMNAQAHKARTESLGLGADLPEREARGAYFRRAAGKALTQLKLGFEDAHRVLGLTGDPRGTTGLGGLRGALSKGIVAFATWYMASDENRKLTAEFIEGGTDMALEALKEAYQAQMLPASVAVAVGKLLKDMQ